MKPLDAGQCQKYGLPYNDHSWCGSLVDIPASAAVVDFVISDRDGRVWDNNNNRYGPFYVT